MTPKSREIDCAYCGERMVPTREHVLPTWIREQVTDHVLASPVRGRHAFGGNPDVVLRGLGRMNKDFRRELIRRLDELKKHPRQGAMGQ
jgi:hypothetical protein